MLCNDIYLSLHAVKCDISREFRKRYTCPFIIKKLKIFGLQFIHANYYDFALKQTSESELLLSRVYISVTLNDFFLHAYILYFNYLQKSTCVILIIRIRYVNQNEEKIYIIIMFYLSLGCKTLLLCIKHT